ncbi:MAG TPA: hypothetical protein VGP16_25760, partial [Asanoa sp.]|nr:hypothetical protein [Asanoa sp.]
DLAVVGKVTEEVVVLSDGRAVRSGPLRDLLADPGDGYTGSLVASARRLDAALGTAGAATRPVATRPVATRPSATRPEVPRDS